MSEIHIEGLGVLGSMLARRLDEEGVDFTWHDTEAPATAWHVSTGLAYPDGDPTNQRGLARWHERLAATPEAEAVPYVFAHKAPPHGGRYALSADYGPLRMAEPLAVALNVPAFVTNTREEFADRRLTVEEAGRLDPKVTPRIICHTTPERGDGYLWGWVARVTFDLPPEVAADCLGEQPALYAKAHRFDLTYAYPIPGTGQWWAGSVLRLQRAPKPSSEEALALLFTGWLANAESLLGVSNVMLHGLGQGWRPRERAGDPQRALEVDEGVWSMPPMPTDGVRRGWLVVDDFIDRWMLL